MIKAVFMRNRSGHCRSFSRKEERISGCPDKLFGQAKGKLGCIRTEAVEMGKKESSHYSSPC